MASAFAPGTSGGMSNYEKVPKELFGQVLSQFRLSTRDRMRCQQVCSTWNSMMDPAVARNLDVWGRKLKVHLSTLAETEAQVGMQAHDVRDHLAPRCRPVLTIRMSAARSSTLHPLTPKDQAFTQWLARHASAFQEIELILTGSPAVQLAHVLTTLSKRKPNEGSIDVTAVFVGEA